MRITIELDTEQTEDAERLSAILSTLNGEHEARQDAELAELRAALTGHGHDAAPVPGPVELEPTGAPEPEPVKPVRRKRSVQKSTEAVVATVPTPEAGIREATAALTALVRAGGTARVLAILGSEKYGQAKNLGSVPGELIPALTADLEAALAELIASDG